MYYAIFKDGICRAKVVLDNLDGYVCPIEHDAIVPDPTNRIIVDDYDALTAAPESAEEAPPADEPEPEVKTTRRKRATS
jgi:hypothetical protein